MVHIHDSKDYFDPYPKPLSAIINLGFQSIFGYHDININWMNLLGLLGTTVSLEWYIKYFHDVQLKYFHSPPTRRKDLTILHFNGLEKQIPTF